MLRMKPSYDWIWFFLIFNFCFSRRGKKSIREKSITWCAALTSWGVWREPAWCRGWVWAAVWPALWSIELDACGQIFLQNKRQNPSKSGSITKLHQLTSTTSNISLLSVRQWWEKVHFSSLKLIFKAFSERGLATAADPAVFTDPYSKYRWVPG